MTADGRDPLALAKGFVRAPRLVCARADLLGPSLEYAEVKG